MQELFIYGCGGVGNEIAEHIMNNPSYKLKGFIDDNSQIRKCMGFPSWTFEEVLKMSNKDINVIISIGEPDIRRKLSEKLEKNGFNEITVDLSEHYNSDFSTVGQGTLLHHGSYISVNSKIGKSCLINKDSLVGHDCIIGDCTVLSPRVTLGGNVTVGDNTYIGTGALIRNGINIGNNVIVGMGAVVIKDVEDDSVVVGNPAKYLRNNETHRVFGQTKKN